MNGGERFVQTLRKAGYPKAPKLDGEDFDWLFETTDAKTFLDWFCVNVTEQNVLSEEKLQAFNDLKESGKAILDDKALNEVLKTCKTSHSAVTAMEHVPMEKLEQDIEALKKLRNLHIHRRNKLQMMASTNSHTMLKFKSLEEADAKKLKETLADLKIANNKLNHALDNIVEGVQKLMSFFTVSEAGCELPSPVFVSQVLLEKYLSSEAQSTAALTSFTKEHFFEGLSKLIEGSGENFMLLQLDSKTDCNEEELDNKCKEMMKLQLAYISAKHKLIQARAKRASLKAGLQWAEDHAPAAQSKVSRADILKTRISSLNDEAAQIQTNIDVLKRESLPALVRENAQLLNMPIVKGDYDLQIARQNHYTNKQDLVCSHLMKQKASFELLQLGYELELRKHRDVYRQLKSIIEELRQDSNKLEERVMMMMADACLLPSDKPKNNIDSRDSATHRLYELVDGDQTQKLFRHFSGLESVARKLTQDIVTLKDQLAVSEQEQALLQSNLEADLKSFRDIMYPEGQDLQLNTPEVANHFHKLDTQLEKLNHILLEVLDDLRAKRKILDCDKLHQIEKQLYVYFFQNEGHLRQIVENLESRADISPSV
ncbi:HAUS augmin-like complex subunit 3 [Spea bombifrons]|uniref:HAUS augmin-like complex subunit 3 n=1 Tax=Spea bombifrons TaxID=233779 RepID=UPI00234938D3|nr:HAUS augmin-like complex subunit 3 [Spea bombifrons]